jgi:hypothetical protein
MILRVDLVDSHGRWKHPLPSNSPHDDMILRVDLVGSHGRWTGPCLQTAPSPPGEGWRMRLGLVRVVRRAWWAIRRAAGGV